MVFLTGKHRASGFTLIEVLVSMMMMAICLTVIMNLMSGGLKARLRAENHNRAVDLADLKMQEEMVKQDLEPGIQEGEFESGFSWIVEVTSDVAGNGEEGTKEKEKPGAYLIKVRIMWMNGEKHKKYVVQARWTASGNTSQISRVHSS